MTTHARRGQWLNLAAIICVGMVAAPAAAQQYFFPEDKGVNDPGAYASLAWAGKGRLEKDRTYRFVAIPDSPVAAVYGDPVMHLFKAPLFPNGHDAPVEVAYNNTCTDPSFPSTLPPVTACFTVTPSESGDYWLVVYARDGDSGGRGGFTFHLWIEFPDPTTPPGTRWIVAPRPLPLGGYMQRFPPYTYLAPSDTVETVFVPATPLAATAIVRFEKDRNDPSAHFKPVDYDFGSGVGAASRILGVENPVNEIAFLLMAAGPLGGPVRIVRNDQATGDLDGDGVGDFLENELCTASVVGNNYTGCGGPAGVHNPQDTDNDGIPDYWEVFGCASDQNKLSLRLPLPAQAMCPNNSAGGNRPQLLPAWGASPRHKDVFIEADSRCPDTTCNGRKQLSVDGAKRIAAAFAAGPAASLRNPDGKDGIAVHLDIGSGMTSDPTPWGRTDVGDWGGFSIVDQMFNSASDAAYNYFTPERIGIFRYALLGAISGEVPLSSYLYGYCSTGPSGSCRPSSFVHEMGKNFGLQKGGYHNVNCKPHYISIMNGGYSPAEETRVDTLPLSTLASTSVFSRGEWPPLNPSHVDEPATIPPYSQSLLDHLGDQNDPDYLIRDPQGQFGYSVNLSGGASVDWNRNGAGAESHEQAFLTDAQNCDFDWRADYLGASGIRSRPVMERLDSTTLVVFHTDPSGYIWASRTYLEDFAECGKNSFQSINEGCNQWTSPVMLTSSYRSRGDISAAWATEEDALWLAWSQPNDSGQYPVFTGKIIWKEFYGYRWLDLTSVTQVPHTEHYANGDSVAIAYVPPCPQSGTSAQHCSAGQTPGRIHLVFTGLDGVLYEAQRPLGSPSSPGSWPSSLPTVVTTSGGGIRNGQFAPSLAVGYPTGRPPTDSRGVYEGGPVLYGLFTSLYQAQGGVDDPVRIPIDTMAIHQRLESGVWVVDSIEAALAPPSRGKPCSISPIMTTVTPGLAYWPLAPHTPTLGGRLFVWFKPPNQSSLWWYQDFVTRRFEGRCGYQVNAFADWDQYGKQTLYFDSRSQGRRRVRGVRTTQSMTALGLFPYADGTIDMDLYDQDDWTVMSSEVCHSLIGRNDERCAPFACQVGTCPSY